MHEPAIRAQVLALVQAGVNDCEIARRLGLPRTTVRDWRRPTYTHLVGPRLPSTCARCWKPMIAVSFAANDYAEMLGLYLGDGYICRVNPVYRLRISLDAHHAGVVGDTAELMRRCFPHNRVGRVTADRGSTVVLSVYHRHLPCLFPQHGPGKKRERRICLEPWQQEIVDASPWSFLRGCIRSDGCVFVNRTGRYEYLSYDFTNHSTDILDIFEATCVALGLRARRYARHIRLYRRADVALLVHHVGIKQ